MVSSGYLAYNPKSSSTKLKGLFFSFLHLKSKLKQLSVMLQEKLMWVSKKAFSAIL